MTQLPGPLVSADWLAEHLDDVILADVRWNIAAGPQPDEHAAGHLPGAVFVDLDADLSAPAGSEGRHPLPTAEAFAAARGRLGLAGRPIVAYDAANGAIAARLWWLLDSIGVDAAVLDGGLAAWTGPQEVGSVVPKAVEVAVVEWPADRFVDVDDVLDAIAAGATHLDARSFERFAGEANPIDARPGHIPGSFSRPWQDNLDTQGRFRPATELVGELGPDVHPDIVASCGSGVTGCHNLLAARLAGNPSGRLYTGSWSEWSLDEQRPVAADEG
jgi:thiosulfate/3-mercaptopyruvate sulfurtransferase